MILVSTSEIPEKRILTVHGLVIGSTVHSKNIGRDIMAGFRTLVGGEVKEYAKMMEEARQVAIKRMIDQAEKYGANAIVNIRLSTSSIMAGAAEIIAYGTAVTVE
ncbi:MAG TPA: YbjQ family protein [Clostridiales bacterium]|nr:YbjQ family protein [Clostridiales bacterium]